MQSSISFLFVLLVLHLISASTHSGEGEHFLKIHKLTDSSSFGDALSFAHYYQKCPEAESIINNKVKEWIKKDYTLAASLIRLHFHDCSVRVRILHNQNFKISVWYSLFFSFLNMRLFGKVVPVKK